MREHRFSLCVSCPGWPPGGSPDKIHGDNLEVIRCVQAAFLSIVRLPFPCKARVAYGAFVLRGAAHANCGCSHHRNGSGGTCVRVCVGSAHMRTICLIIMWVTWGALTMQLHCGVVRCGTHVCACAHVIVETSKGCCVCQNAMTMHTGIVSRTACARHTCEGKYTIGRQCQCGVLIPATPPKSHLR